VSVDLGPTYTQGNSFRARAEARQREYRARTLKVGWSRYGHLLDDQTADPGMNFVVPEAFQAAKERKEAGKGVTRRTFRNMLSSQAMCFNLFAPLAADMGLAATVLSRFFPDLAEVTDLAIEHTPDKDVFCDQSGTAGVDCDVLIHGQDASGQSLVIVVETKFVEEEFSTCGFRKSGASEVCPDDVRVVDDTGHCLYASKKGYRYWDRTVEHGFLAAGALPEAGCPFGGQLWQLWVNYTLAHVEASRSGTTKASFAVCAPGGNSELLQDGQILEQFRRLLKSPESLVFIDVELLIDAIREATVGGGHAQAKWATGLASRYANI